MKEDGERILDAIKNADDPLTTSDLVEMLGLKRTVVYQETFNLVKYGKIKRYRGLQGVFVLAAEEGVSL